ncbi:MAG: YebC/PmpR family DNA-binding transcriptional regulator [Clostridia bacterium]|nr:YebC/PmpR family DNA-binding transcriptional regulator [Clostridia bacterium]
MSGHSKWANIKNKKAKGDAQRSNTFTKIGREIAIAVKQGGSNPDSNSRLRDVIAKAKAANMPNDNIKRSIQKASGELGNVNYEEVTYEGYGAGGVAVIVECLTDNKTRTVGDVRHYFDKCGGQLGNNGCVSFMFNKQGVIVIDSQGLEEDDLMMMALEAGADDVITEEGVYEVITTPAGYSQTREALENAGLNIISSGVELIPQNTVTPDDETAKKVIRLIDMLEDNDDVQNVYHNANLPEEEEEE